MQSTEAMIDGIRAGTCPGCRQMHAVERCDPQQVNARFARELEAYACKCCQWKGMIWTTTALYSLSMFTGTLEGVTVDIPLEPEVKSTPRIL